MAARLSLISPNNAGSYRSAQIVAENLGIANLAAHAEALGHAAQLVDARLWDQDAEHVAGSVAEFGPNLVGVSLICEEAVPWTNEFLNALSRFPVRPVVVAGGYYPTLQPERSLDLMPHVDAIVMGEGEKALEELLMRLTDPDDRDHSWREGPGLCLRDDSDQRFRRTKRPPLVQDLDKLAWPVRYAAPRMDASFEVLIEGSRGCKLACTFCAIRPFFQSSGTSVWRGRTPESLVAEMAALRRVNPRLKKFRFVDPDFIGFETEGTKRALHLAQLIIEKLPGIEFYIEVRAKSVIGNADVFAALQLAGLREAYIGVESGSQRILDAILKQTTVQENIDAVTTLKSLGISVAFGFMMFTPWTDEDDLHANISLLRKIGGVQFDKLFHEMELIPGTPALKQGKSLGSIVEKPGTGYYTYKMTDIAERARRCGRSLDSRHRQFMEDVWFLYKDAQRSIQTGSDAGRELERRVTELNLTMFEFCMSGLLQGTSNDNAAIDQVADACVTAFRPTVDRIGAAIADEGRFARRETVRREPAGPSLGP